MSRIKELKTNTNNNLNLIEVLELFSPEKKTKYTELLLKMMNNTKMLKEHAKEIKANLLNNFEFIGEEDLNKYGEIQLMWIYRFIDTFFNTSDLVNFRKFCDYNERGLIEQNDLTKYKSFEEVINQMAVADMKAEEKEMESQIIKIYEDDEWLMVKPLTHLSSRKYGSNTKWCTTQENNPDYFFKYTKRGVLIYNINKKNGYKVAAFYSLDKNEPEFSYWNQKDSRIDSTESELPMELIGFIRDHVKDSKMKTNHFFFETNDKDNKKTDGKSGRMSRRIENAVRRGVEEIVSEETNVMEEAPDYPLPVEENVTRPSSSFRINGD